MTLSLKRVSNRNPVAGSTDSTDGRRYLPSIFLLCPPNSYLWRALHLTILANPRGKENISLLGVPEKAQG
jgi:hypothetical protein